MFCVQIVNELMTWSSVPRRVPRALLRPLRGSWAPGMPGLCPGSVWYTSGFSFAHNSPPHCAVFWQIHHTKRGVVRPPPPAPHPATARSEIPRLLQYPDDVNLKGLPQNSCMSGTRESRPPGAAPVLCRLLCAIALRDGDPSVEGEGRG